MSAGEDVMTDESEIATSEAESEKEKHRMDLTVDVQSVGPCKKHVVVTIPEADIAAVRDEALAELGESASVPGFRVGRAPRSLLEKRFKEEIVAQVKQKVLLQSLEQLSDDNSIDPINQPDINVESLDIPESGDFRYEFDVEVRPEFEIPDYKSFTISRPVGGVSDEEFDAFRQEFLSSYAERNTVQRPAEPGDFVVCNVRFTHNGKSLRESEGLSLQLHPVLRFHDAVLEGFDKLMEGAGTGDNRSAEVTISLQSPVVEMRGEKVAVEFSVLNVQEQVLPRMEREFLDRVNCDSEEDLNEHLRSSLERQIEFRQRQATREQVLEKILDSATWDLPESLVKQQTENALRREILEMAQAGFTREQIAARENQIRQNAIDNTRQALKEHFVLDRIATKEEIECEQEDIDRELAMMAFQSGDTVRRIRAKMVKSGMIENLEAQLRERKAVDFILQHTSFKDVKREPYLENDVASVAFAICGNMTATLVDDRASEADEED
ncbi:MAG: trigger factor [Planctomycetaceae bacterium]